jgi:hypothetical protein
LLRCIRTRLAQSGHPEISAICPLSGQRDIGQRLPTNHDLMSTRPSKRIENQRAAVWLLRRL